MHMTSLGVQMSKTVADIPLHQRRNIFVIKQGPQLVRILKSECTCQARLVVIYRITSSPSLGTRTRP